MRRARYKVVLLVHACVLCVALIALSCTTPSPTPRQTLVPATATPTRARPASTPTRVRLASPPARPSPALSPTPGSEPLPAATFVHPSPTPTPALWTGSGINVKGINYDDNSLDRAVALHFEWIKIYDHPPQERLPFKVLYRVNLPHPGEDWEQWVSYRRIDAETYADRIDAYEIGNEPNLIEEWGGEPDPAAYVELLRLAYREIKAVDPDATIVSAGLAPVGEGAGPAYLSDLAYLRGMYEHGAADYFDVLGWHPYGFAYPPEMPVDGEACILSVAPDSSGPELVCRAVDGFCFRRVELARDIMVEFGDGDKPVWATEFGWIIRPPECCLERSDWPARVWQAVSEREQASYIVRAFGYAEAYWPWMDVMFLWNLDYSRYPEANDEKCPACDSMGWFSILNPDGAPRLSYLRLLSRR